MNEIGAFLEENSVGIICTIIGIIFGYFFAKFPIYKGRISIILENITDLFNLSIKKFSRLTILYNKKKISSRIFLLDIVLYNNGRIDLDKKHFDDPFIITFPLDIKIVDVKINSKVGIFKENHPKNEIILSVIKLFKRFEFIPIEILFESDKKINLFLLKRKIKITNRIKDVGKAQIITGYNKEWLVDSLKYNSIPIGMLVILLWLLYSITFNSIADRFVRYYKKHTSQELLNNCELNYPSISNINLNTITNSLMDSNKFKEFNDILINIRDNSISNVGVYLILSEEDITNVLIVKSEYTIKKLYNLKIYYYFVLIILISFILYLINEYVRYFRIRKGITQNEK